ncbi:MAG: LAGLIDADG family homing endonuclease [Pyrinomonadaceae bacterium]
MSCWRRASDDYWCWHEHRTVRNLKVDAALGWLIGFTLGDGSFGYVPSLRQYRLHLFSGATDVLERAREVLGAQGSDVSIHRDKRGLYSVTTLKQDFVHAMLEACGLQKFGAKDKCIRVPEIIAKSPLDVIRAFVAELLDGDGCVDADGSPSYTTASPEMAEDLAALCGLLGYQPRVRAKEPHGKGRSTTYTVQLCVLPQVNRLAQEVGVYMASAARRARLHSDSRKQTRLHVDIEPWRALLRKLGLARERGRTMRGQSGACAEELNYWSCDAEGRSNRDALKRIAALMSEKDDNSGALLNRIAEYGMEIKLVEPATQQKDFYDLTVAEWNTYAAGRHGMAMIHNTGFTFEKLRPAGAMVRSTHGVASGPVSFMNIFNTTTDTVKQGGVRRGANMGIMRVTHPDLLRFIHAKNDQTSLTNFNISVTVTDRFMQAVNNHEWFQLEFDGEPWTEPIFDPLADDNYAVYRRADGSTATFRDKAAFQAVDFAELTREEPPRPGSVYAPDIWNRIVASAHRYAEPGVIYIDEVNRHNHMMNSMGPIYATNPCVTADTLVYTERGLISVGELYKSGQNPDVVVDARFGYAPTFAEASRVFHTGRKPVFRLQTKEGYYVKATANHRIMTAKGWVALQDLKPGDKVHILNRKGGFGISGSLESGRTLGWLVGDGTLTDKRGILSFWGTEQALAPIFATYVNDLIAPYTDPTRSFTQYAIAPQIIADRNETRIASTRLRDLALVNGLNSNEGKLKVPETVFTGSEQMQRGFLQALFSADGTVLDTHYKGIDVRLSSKSIRLLTEVQMLLLNFGIASRIYSNRRPAKGALLPDGKGGRKEYQRCALHDLAISKENVSVFAKEIGFLTEQKQGRLVSAISRLTRGFHRECFIARVESITSKGIEDVYDLTQSDTKSFIANGLAVHNCAEQALHFNNSCNLGSIDLARFYDPETDVQWDRLREAVHLCVRFLDNVIDTCSWPLPEIDDVVKRTRPVGLGVMGFADLLIRLKIAYGSPESIAFMDRVMGFVRRESWAASISLGAEKGVFPELKPNEELYSRFIYDHLGIGREIPLTLRNYEVTTIAPTGTISLVAETSSGIEPNFSWAYVREDTLGKRTYVHTLAAEALGLEVDQTDQASIDRAAEHVVAHQDELPSHFIAAMDIAKQHVEVLGAAQRNVDNGVSKRATAGGRHARIRG